MREDMEKRTAAAVWGGVRECGTEPSCFGVGELRIYVRFVDSEVHVAHEYVAGEAGAPGRATVGHSAWSRWVLKGEASGVRLQPSFPDRAVVVKPDTPFHLPKGAQTKIFVRVPVWVKVLLDGEKETLLTTVPTSVLSNTWFGSFGEGELCYWLSSGFRRQATADATKPGLVVCPLRLYNRSGDDFSVEKICLRLDNYSLFYDGSQLWSDEIRILYKGPENISQVKVVGKPPEESPDAALVSGPKKEIRKSFAAKTFSSLKELSGLGFPGG